MPAKVNLIYLTPATEDMQEIVKFHILEVGTEPARKIYQTLRDEINRLQEFPLLGQVHPDPKLAALGYRKLVLTRTYVAVYKITDGTIYVYRVVNGKTNYSKLLK